MSNEFLKSMNTISYWFQEANRPSMILQPTISKNIRYEACLGCVTGKGDTPDEAYRDFDKKWVGK